MSIFNFNNNIKKLNVGGLKSCLAAGLKNVRSFFYDYIVTPYDNKLSQTSLEDLQNYFLSLNWRGGIYPYEIKKAIPITNNDGLVTHYKSITIPMPVQSTGIFQCYVVNNGSGYDLSATVEFPEPEQQGVRASGQITFGLSKESFILQDGGSNYSVGDFLFIMKDEQPKTKDSVLCTINIDNVSDSGEIVDYSILGSQSITIPPSGIIVFSSQNNASASFSFVDNKYTIDFITITNPGSGYVIYDPETKQPTIREISINDTVGGSGLYVVLSQHNVVKQSIDREELEQLIDTNLYKEFSRSNIFYKDKYGKILPSMDLIDQNYR